MSNVHFAAPLYLWALCLLPFLWWLLRLTPPKPQRQVFPPLRLMAQFAGGQTAAAKSPWWLTALRLLMAAALIGAFARPFYQSSAAPAAANGALALLWDNDWAGAANQARRQREAELLIAAAGKQSNAIYLIPAISAPDAPTGPYSAAAAAALAADKNYYGQNYHALPPDRSAAFARLSKIMAENGDKALTIAYLTGGLAGPNDKQAFAQLAELMKIRQNSGGGTVSLLWYQPPLPSFIGISAAENAADGLRFTIIRPAALAAAPLSVRVKAYDAQEQVLAEETADFAAGKAEASGRFNLPPAYANKAAALKAFAANAGGAAPNTAAAVWLLNSNDKQKTVGILAPNSGALAQPLLSPLYYAAKALENSPGVAGGKAMQADSNTLESSIDKLLAAKPALLIMGDTAAIAPPAREKLRRWVEQGGTLLRFGGAKLANAGSDAAADESEAAAIFGSADAADEEALMPPPAAEPALIDPGQMLLPVRLRRFERSFGGSLSWEQPQKIAPFPPASPFYGMAAPQDIRISKQILAEPSADLADKSWISLTDGTPLMTAAPLGKGRLILLHTEPSGSWSNLALSGFFVEMLQRLVKISDSSGSAALNAEPQRNYAPYQILTAEGSLKPAPETVQALQLEPRGGKQSAPQPSFANPPGLYGGNGAFYPLNLLNKTSRIAALAKPQIAGLQARGYSNALGAALQKALFFLAACLFIIDIFVSLLLKSRFALPAAGGLRQNLFSRAAKFKNSVLPLLLAAFLAPPLCLSAGLGLKAQAASPAAVNAPALAGKTHLAYVLSGDAALDSVSKTGLENLSRFIERRTTIEPGEPVGINPERDELAFYPLIYWPISADTPNPTAKALAAADAFMQRGGTILFDTRDALEGGLKLSGAGANTARLRAMLKNMNVPPLIPAPAENVVARSFYIMPDFPGRYRSSPLWIAASADLGGNNSAGGSRSIRGGDGVSPILITANDFAAAWAGDGKGGFLFPLIPDGEEQRLWSFRGGLNIVMYVLTGNYKADQAHTPELLRRFGKDD